MPPFCLLALALIPQHIHQVVYAHQCGWVLFAQHRLCSTAESRAQTLLDKVVHLASGFQMAGFPHVVASVWLVEDESCVEMAREFYGWVKGGFVNNWAVATAVTRLNFEAPVDVEVMLTTMDAIRAPGNLSAWLPIVVFWEMVDAFYRNKRHSNWASN
jgi:CHAT domain